MTRRPKSGICGQASACNPLVGTSPTSTQSNSSPTATLSGLAQTMPRAVSLTCALTANSISIRTSKSFVASPPLHSPYRAGSYLAATTTTTAMSGIHCALNAWAFSPAMKIASPALVSRVTAKRSAPGAGTISSKSGPSETRFFLFSFSLSVFIPFTPFLYHTIGYEHLVLLLLVYCSVFIYTIEISVEHNIA